MLLGLHFLDTVAMTVIAATDFVPPTVAAAVVVVHVLVLEQKELLRMDSHGYSHSRTAVVHILYYLLEMAVVHILYYLLVMDYWHLDYPDLVAATTAAGMKQRSHIGGSSTPDSIESETDCSLPSSKTGSVGLMLD